MSKMANQEFLYHSKFHIALLGPRDKYCIIAKNHLTNDVETKWLEAHEIIPYTAEKNKEGYTVWISLNDKELGEDSIKGVKGLCDLWFDIDSLRKDKSIVATEEELQEALDRAITLKSNIEKKYQAKGYLAYSGNGFHLHFPLPYYPLIGRQFREEVNEKLRRFAKKTASDVNVVIDHTYDLRRVTTLIGSLNLKIIDKPLQTSWYKDIFKNGLEKALEDLERARELNGYLLEAILNTPIKTYDFTNPQIIKKHFEFQELLNRDQKLRDLYNGEWEKYGYPSRSEAEQALLVKLIYYGFTEEEITEIMSTSKIGKWIERPEIYRIHSLKKAREYIANPTITQLEEKPKEDIKKYFDDKNRFIPQYLANEIMNKFNFITMKDTDETYVYEDGVYKPYGESVIKTECEKHLGVEYRKNRVAEVIDYIKSSTYVERREEPPNLIPLKNGILDLNTMQLKQYSHEYMFFNKIPVKYDPNIDCPNTKKFLKDITSDENDVKILEEIIGFTLYREYFISKALMLVGEGSNGKSTFLNLIKIFLGPGNTSSRSLHELETNRFAKADLQHKLANIYADLPDKALHTTGTFKMLTGKDPITGEKKFRNSFQFTNYAKLLFSTNKVPEAYDDSNAFFRRWIIIIFPNTFEDDKADPHILEKLTTESELTGLLNLALQGLKRLLKNKKFSYSKTTEEIKKDYIRKSSPIASFVMDCLTTDTDAFIEKKHLYNVFTEYCRIRKISAVTEQTFFKNLPIYVNISDVRPEINHERLRLFKGIRFKPDNPVSKMSIMSMYFYILYYNLPYFDTSSFEYTHEVDSKYIKIKVRKNMDIADSLDGKSGEGDSNG